MEFTVEQIAALAPDASSLTAGKKLSAPRDWKSTGRTVESLWGECQGSALYQVKVDLAAFAYNCSCPSRKLPCKHVLGLLFLAAGSTQVAEGEPPEWVTAWLAKRAETAKKKEEKQQAAEAKPVDDAAQAKRAAKRQANVADGIARLDLWMADLVRSGLAGLERKPRSFWSDQSKRLVDAQAKGLATRVDRLGDLIGVGRRWPQDVLIELGRLSLVTEAFRRLDSLEPPLQSDIRQIVGWTVGSQEVQASGDPIRDRWLVMGQSVDEEERIRVERNWLLGLQSRRSALVLQFAFGKQAFPLAILPATVIDATLAFYPSACPQRAQIVERLRDEPRFSEPFPGGTVEELLDSFADALARNPWLDSWPVALRQMRIAPDADGPWRACDEFERSIPLARSTHWTLLALSGGRPIDVAGIWNGHSLEPLGAIFEGTYVSVNRGL